MLIPTFEGRGVGGLIFGGEIFLSLFQNDAFGSDVVLFLGLGRLEELGGIPGLKIFDEDDGSEVVGDGRMKERLRERNIESFKNVLQFRLN